jgi:Ca2+-binding EF-hand superfamily protein
MRARGEVLARLERLPERSILHKCTALLIARVFRSASELQAFKRLFYELDSTGNGRLGVKQLCDSLERCCGLGTAQAMTVSQAMDLSRDGMVDWTEFVAACIDLGDSSLNEDLRRVFEEADSDGDGFLVIRDITDFLHLASDHLHSEAARDIMFELSGSRDVDVKVDWRTFRRYFTSIGTRPPVSTRRPKPRMEPKPMNAVDIIGYHAWNIYEQGCEFLRDAPKLSPSEAAPTAKQQHYGITRDDVESIFRDTEEEIAQGFTERITGVEALDRLCKAQLDVDSVEVVAKPPLHVFVE